MAGGGEECRQGLVALEEQEDRGQPERGEDRVQRRAQALVDLAEPLGHLPVEAPRQLHPADEVDVHRAQQEREHRPAEADEAHSGHRLLFATTASSGIEFGWPSGSAAGRVEAPVAAAPADVACRSRSGSRSASTYTEFASTPITSAPSSATRTPRRTLPRTSPAMYAEYWNPMNWNSSTPSMNGKTVVEKMLLKKLFWRWRSGPPSSRSGRCAPR